LRHLGSVEAFGPCLDIGRAPSAGGTVDFTAQARPLAGDESAVAVVFLFDPGPVCQDQGLASPPVFEQSARLVEPHALGK
jgi:hypothetical protein